MLWEEKLPISGQTQSLFSTMTLAAAAVLGALAASSSEASATACCEVLRTKDGFVALRKGPSPSARLIQKVPSGREICFGTVRPETPHSPSWDFGMFVDDAKVPHWGWVNKRLLSKQCG